MQSLNNTVLNKEILEGLLSNMTGQYFQYIKIIQIHNVNNSENENEKKM